MNNIEFNREKNTYCHKPLKNHQRIQYSTKNLPEFLTFTQSITRHTLRMSNDFVPWNSKVTDVYSQTEPCFILTAYPIFKLQLLLLKEIILRPDTISEQVYRKLSVVVKDCRNRTSACLTAILLAWLPTTRCSMKFNHEN